MMFFLFFLCAFVVKSNDFLRTRHNFAVYMGTKPPPEPRPQA